MCKHIVVGSRFILYELQVLQRVSNNKRWHSHSLKVIGNHAIWWAIFVFHCHYVCLAPFSGYYCLFPKLKDVKWMCPCHLIGQFVMPVQKCHVANQCTKFGVSSFCHFGDILGGLRIWGWFITPLARLDIISLCTKFDSSSLSHCWNMDGASKI